MSKTAEQEMCCASARPGGGIECHGEPAARGPTVASDWRPRGPRSGRFGAIAVPPEMDSTRLLFE